MGIGGRIPPLLEAAGIRQILLGNAPPAIMFSPEKAALCPHPETPF
jgi:hypothetical protein